jgi:hypothetical protein
LVALSAQGDLTQKGLANMKKLDDKNILKNWTHQKLSAENEKLNTQMQERGFGLTWTASINGFGLQVENVDKWMAYMVLEFEKTSGTRVSANP